MSNNELNNVKDALRRIANQLDVMSQTPGTPQASQATSLSSADWLFVVFLNKFLIATVWQEILAGSNSEKLITSKKNQSVLIEKKLFPQNTTNSQSAELVLISQVECWLLNWHVVV